MTETEQRYARYMLQCEDTELPLIMAAKAKGGRRTVNLTPTAIKAIESILSKGDRAEVIPTKEGPKVTRTVREVAYDPKKETRPG